MDNEPMAEPFRPCAVIPVFNHVEKLSGVIDALQAHGLYCFLIDDGSRPEESAALQRIAGTTKNVELHRLSWNQGKGAAVMDGLMRAYAVGFTHAVQIDADGQHDSKALPELLAKAQSHPLSLISGAPEYDDSAPKSRLYGRKITQFWVALETLSRNIPDAMIGFRVYPLQAMCALIQRVDLSRRMDFDIESIVRLYWAGLDIVPVPVRIQYPDDGVSHFHAVQDNIRISRLHSRLFFGMFLRIPSLLKRRRSSSDEHWADTRERGTTLGIKILLNTYSLLGHRAFSLMLLPVMAYFFVTGRQARQASRQYLSWLYDHAPETFKERPGWKTSFLHFINFGHCLADRFGAWSGKITLSQLDMVGEEPLQSALSSGQGVVLLVSHLGNVELCRALADIRKDGAPLRVNVLVHTEHAPAFNKVMEQVNPDSNVRLIQVSDIGPDTSIMLAEMIEQGEIVAIAADRLPANAENMSVEVDFLDHPAQLPKGPFILASILKCPVFTLFCTRSGNGRYRLEVEAFADPLLLPRKQRQQTLQGVAQKYAQRLEAVCQRSPLEWFNFFDFWGSDMSHSGARATDARISEANSTDLKNKVQSGMNQ